MYTQVRAMSAEARQAVAALPAAALLGAAAGPGADGPSEACPSLRGGWAYRVGLVGLEHAPHARVHVCILTCMACVWPVQVGLVGKPSAGMCMACSNMQPVHAHTCASSRLAWGWWASPPPASRRS